jgi:uncharacterized paraquat-inducible protein A
LAASLRRIEDHLLGKLAVQQGLCTQAEVEECLRIQAQAEEHPSLGDLLLFKGYLSAPQLRDLLARQHKKVMACPRCKLSFTVLTLSQGKSARCPRCKGPLAETRPGGPTRTDAQISTQRMRMARPSASPPEPAVRRAKMICVICDKSFDWAPDATGRLQCPSCQSTFRSRNQ